jgi:CMP-N-acetylneuraminic acid synthetase
MIFFVPARKGSSRVKLKNTRELGGKPLITWTLEQIERIGLYHAIVSSDDPEVLALAAREGFHPSPRPEELASSWATMSDVLTYHLPQFKEHAAVCVLYPTSPLRTDDQILQAIKLWQTLGSTSKPVMSVTPVCHRPYGLMKVANGFLKCNSSLAEKFYQSQQMPLEYRANGAIFILPTRLIEQKKLNTQLFNETTLPFIMDQTSSLEIDTEEELAIVEAVMKQRQGVAA